MRLVVAVLLGLGVFLVFDGLTRTRAGAPRVAVGPVRRWLATSGLGHVSPVHYLVGSAGAGLVAGSIALTVIGSAGVALVACLAGGAAPTAVARARRRSLGAQRRRAWPEAIELLAGSVRAGDTLPAAVAVVADRGPDALRPVFRSVVTDHRVTGDLAGALERMGAAIADPIGDRVVHTLVLAHRVGGRELGRLLRTLSAFLREDVATRREIESRQSWTVVAARVSAAAPWLVLLLVASRPQGARAFDSPTGVAVLLVGATVTGIGYRLMIRVGQLPEESRVLAEQSG